ncbi:MAG: lamin tail domain-containing protein [Deltaproteobacteria bacterium]|nr:lamin tail domain-containing protein [Deltaproteobacteria bacterium]
MVVSGNCPITSSSITGADVLVDLSAPLPAGSPEQYVVPSLTPSVTYCFALQVFDDVSLSAISNVVTATTGTPPDVTAPAAAVLSAGTATPTSVTLSWTDVGDDGTTGTAATWFLRRAQGASCPITTATGGAEVGTGTPSAPGSTSGATDSTLVSDQTYCFALVVSDEAGNSSVSNSVTVTTPDVLFPDNPVLAAGAITGSSVELTWSAVGDNAGSGAAAGYLIGWAVGDCTAFDFPSSTQVAVTGGVAAGTAMSQVITLAGDQQYCFRLRADDDAANASYSNTISARTLDTVAPAAVTDLAASATGVTRVTLSWTAPGDNNTTGTAAAYDLRFLAGVACPITDANFGSATAVTTAPAPAAPGTTESVDVTGLTADTDYCFALTTSDEVPNTSALSNVLLVHTRPDPVAQLAAIRVAIGAGATVDHPLNGGVVTYVKPAFGGAAVGAADGPGFFIQNGATGPALFFAVDPVTIAADLAPGDVVDLHATRGAWLSCSGCSADNSIYVVDQLSSGARTGTGATLPAAQDLSSDARFLAPIPTPAPAGGWELDAERVTVRGVMGVSPVSAGTGFHKFRLDTAGSPAPSQLFLRAPTSVFVSLGLAPGCDVTVSGTPMWRFSLEAQVAAWQTADIIVNSCPNLAVLATQPADAAVNAAVTSTLTVEFNQPVNVSTATFQPTAGACTGEIQLSSDGFQTCLGLTGAAWDAFNHQVAFTVEPGMSFGASYQARVGTGVAAVRGSTLATAYPWTFTTPLAPVCSTATHPLIVEAFGGGGNSGAAWNRDFVVLFNPTSSAVPLSGWSLQVASATTTGNWTLITLSGSIAANGYYMIGLASGTNGAAVPSPDAASTSTVLGGAGGKVALVNNTTILNGTCPTSTAIVDVLGWGTTSGGSPVTCFETAAAPTTTAATAVSRTVQCSDANDNSTEFVLAAPNPRNTASPTFPCACTANETGETTERGNLLEADYCVLQFPQADFSVAPGAVIDGTTTTPTVGGLYGRIYEVTVTEAAGANPAVTAQWGYGPLLANPEWETGWTWVNAPFNTQSGNDDEYGAPAGAAPGFTAPATAGAYLFTFRFSLDAGLSWTYCDINGAGSNSGLFFDVTRLPIMTVQ